MAGIASILRVVFSALLSTGRSGMSNATPTSTILESIITLGGLLGPTINGHTKAVKAAGEILTQITSAAAEGQWSQVLSLANSLFNIQGLSTASLNAARALVTAAQNAMNLTAGVGVGANAIQLASLNATNQQLVLSEVAGLRTQMANETHGIFGNLLGLHSLAVTGS